MTTGPDSGRVHVVRHVEALPVAWHGAVLVLGNLDGVHRGHQALIAQAADIAAPSGAPVAVMTFEPHPRRVFRPDAPPFRLSSVRHKVTRLGQLGVALVLLQRFHTGFLGQSADAFVEDLLIGAAGVRHVVVGADFRFGRGRAGDVALMTRVAARHGVGVTGCDLLCDERGVPISSTRIRNLLAEGRPRDAAGLLGAPWQIDGRVRRGDRLGRTLGFPTANLILGAHHRPAGGVYAVRAAIGDGHPTVWHPGVANFGHRPTVTGRDERFEVHLFDLDADLYGLRLHIQLIEHLRTERRFDSLDDLKAQIARDAERARTVLASPPR